MTATPANNAEQVIFSDTGAILTLTGNQSGLATTPFGFWIWCAGSAAPVSNGGYQNANENPPNSGLYTMHVVEGTAAELFSGNLNPSFSCTLANTTAAANLTNGPGNTVQVNCMFFRLGGGTGSDTDNGVVVNITGPN